MASAIDRWALATICWQAGCLAITGCRLVGLRIAARQPLQLYRPPLSFAAGHVQDAAARTVVQPVGAEVEAQTRVRIDLLCFLGLTLTDPVPDETALVRFRQRLMQKNLVTMLFDLLKDQLAAKGLLVKKHTLIDGSLLQSVWRKTNLTSPYWPSPTTCNAWRYCVDRCAQNPGNGQEIPKAGVSRPLIRPCYPGFRLPRTSVMTYRSTQCRFTGFSNYHFNE